jgi:phage tail-like protein
MSFKTIDDRGSILTDPLRSFRFKAVFEPANGGTAFDSRIISSTGTGTGVNQGFTGGFTNVSGLSQAVTPIQYREGGYNTTLHQIPGMTATSPISMSRGVLWGNDQSITWMRGVLAVAAGEGLNVSNTDYSATFRCNIKLFVMDHPNSDGHTNDPRMGFLIRNAWLAGVSYTNLDATSNTIMMEDMSFVHEGISVFFTETDGTPSDYKPEGVGW